MLSRRTLLQLSGATMVAGALGESVARAAETGQANGVGLQLATVRGALVLDYKGTLTKVAELGYKGVELVRVSSTISATGNMDPKTFRAFTDKLGLSVWSSQGAAIEGPDLEKQLEGFQILGLKYAQISPPPPPPDPSRPARATVGFSVRMPGDPPPPVRPTSPHKTQDEVKRVCEKLNRDGQILKKYGMKTFVHNHTIEFEPLADSTKTYYDVILAETDPSVVVMEFDIGWAAVGGQNIIDMFKKSPGRFELWHVKDAVGITRMDPALTPEQRDTQATMMPIGLGEIDYKSIFTYAQRAGMKYFFVEHDNAGSWGDYFSAIDVSLKYLQKISAQ